MLRLLFRLLFGARKPITAGELTVKGLDRPAVIRRDRFGIPHIDAETDRDAAFAFGFVQAQDRAGQLETYLRIIRGTLAELVGPAGLPVDRLSRRIGFRRAACEQLKIIDDDIRQFLDAFTAGINAGFQDGSPQWPHEFALLKSTPSPWDAADVLAYVKFISFQLPSNWDVELARFLMLREDGASSVLALDPLGAGIGKQESGSREEKTSGMAILIEELKALNEFAPRGGGSNNWVVNGSRSASGKPVLASDPHLGPTLPNPWYLAHLRTPRWSVAGAAFAGTPVFPIGHNGFACWGVTAGLTDTTDLFLETLDGHKALQPDGSWIDCEIVPETIRVKGGEAVIEEVLLTPRGPMVTPLIPGETVAISLKAVWLQARPMRGFFEAVRAKSFAEFRKPFAAWPVLPLNVIYADETGAIGYQLIGDLPIRRGGTGLMPTPVQHGDWAGYVPFAEMPFTVNPECGFLATANDDPYSWCPSHVPSPPHLGQDFIDAYRAETIREELAQRMDWSVPAFQQLQLNLRSKPWAELRDLVLALEAADADAKLALEELRGWDGLVAVDSPAAAVFELFVAEMCVRVAKAKAPQCWVLALGGSDHGPFANNLLSDRRVKHLIALVHSQPAGWFARTWSEELLDALGAAVRKLRSDVGPSPPYWAWGHRRMLRLRHPLFGKHWLFARIFTIGPVPFGGDANTIQQAAVRPLTPLAETHNFPNLRTSFDVANWSNCRFALAGGQSGNPCSRHYDDQFPLWLRGEGVPMPWTADEVIRSAVGALRLTPG